MTSGKALRANHLSCEDLRARQLREPLLNDISVLITPGHHCAVIGRSGSGKTLLMRSLIGLTRASPLLRLSGELYLGSDSLLRLADKPFRRLISKRTGWVPQDPYRALNPHLNIGCQLWSLIAQRMNISLQHAVEVQREVFDVAGLGKLEPLLTRLPSQCSGGELQRLLICAALAHEPEWLLADEPLTSLDPRTRHSMTDWLVDMLAEHQTTLIMSSHDYSTVRRLCSHLIGLSGGSVMCDQSIESFPSDPLHPDLADLLEADRWWQSVSSSSIR